MSIQTPGRLGIAFFLVAFISGCSSIGLGGSDIGNKCKWNRSSCMHEGSYEQGEREYAEEEAKDLNKDASKRLRRSVK